MNKRFFLLALAAISLSAAQGLTMISSVQSPTQVDGVRLQNAPDQQLSATFWIQGDDVALSQLTVQESRALKGLSAASLQASDMGYQAQLLLNTTFSAQIDGAPAQADAVSALQSLVAAAAVQGYSTIPTGSYLKFTHSYDFSKQPLPQAAAQINEFYTLQSMLQGLSSTASATGLWKPASAAKPAAKPVTTKPVTTKPVTTKPALPKLPTKPVLPPRAK